MLVGRGGFGQSVYQEPIAGGDRRSRVRSSDMRFTTDEFIELVELALTDIPEAFAAYLRDVTIDVEPMPDRQACREAGIANPRTLLGLYRGTPLTGRSVEHNARLPDRITIYQHNIERMGRTREQIVDQVRTTVFHEIGHHFGLDEDDLDELGYQ